MYMTERFGAWQVGEDVEGGKVAFKVFFPDRAKDPSQYQATRFNDAGKEVADFGNPKIVSIRVAGSFQESLGQTNWDFANAPEMIRVPHDKGWVWEYETAVALTKGFYEYKY